ncbi:hypothetical protein EJB05_32039, partial [Eragrostis curvula]
MEGAAVVKCMGKWRAVQFAAVMLCVLIYAQRLSVPTDMLAPLHRRVGGGGDDHEEEKDGGAVGLDNQVGSPAAVFLGSPRVGVADGDDDVVGPVVVLDNQAGSPCSSMPAHSICCDRSDDNADVCFMAGDVRTDAKSLSLLLFPPPPAPGATITVQEERIRPYTRKWEKKTMATIHEVRLRTARPEDYEAAGNRCDVRHGAPVHVVTGAGGYNGGNYFHAFNDGFLPSWLTAQHLRRRVVLAVLAYDRRWAGWYAEVIAGLSEYPVVDLLADNRTHCFPGAIVGTRFHGYLAVDPARLRDNKTIVDFHAFLAAAYGSPSSQAGGDGEPAETSHRKQSRPRLGIVSRGGTRVIENEAAVARLAESVGFDVEILPATKATAPPLEATHAAVSALDALLGVHGSDLTSFLFLRPGRGAALVQVAPLGIADLARGVFGAPAKRMGLRYEQYDVRASESSLSRVYAPDDVVVADPQRAKIRQGSGDHWDWDFIGRVYINGQNVSLDLARFGETLARVHSWLLEQQEENGSA